MLGLQMRNVISGNLFQNLSDGVCAISRGPFIRQNVISNNTFINTSAPVMFEASSVYNSIKGNTMNSCYIGIILGGNVSRNRIYKNNISHCRSCGIVGVGSSWNDIFANTISDSFVGISLDQSCHFNHLAYNNLERNGYFVFPYVYLLLDGNGRIGCLKSAAERPDGG